MTPRPMLWKRLPVPSSRRTAAVRSEKSAVNGSVPMPYRIMQTVRARMKARIWFSVIDETNWPAERYAAPNRSEPR